MKNYIERAVAIIFSLTLIFMAGCGGNDDPVIKSLNDELDVDIEEFNANNSVLYPGEELKIEWRTEGALLFDARLYLSADRSISHDDYILVDEECGVEHNDHCYASREVTFRCLYESDNYFSCREDGHTLQHNDLTQFFPELPFSGYLILELCGDENCDERSHALTFQ